MSYITNLPVNNIFNVTSYFGQQNASLWKNGHKGIDITGDKTLYSICDGTVTYQGYDNGWGYYVSVMPNGFERVRFILCHMVKGSIKVKKGDKVTRTTVLGTMGSTGNSTGVHVHVECRIDNVAVDPTPYLKIKNEKVTGLNAINYKTTQEESNSILQQMQDAKDGKVSAPSINFETLYKQELENNSALEIEVLNLKEQVNKLADKINAAKAALN